MKTNIYVLYGGKSIEHEVSVISASAVLNAIDKKNYKVYPVFITKEGQFVPYGLLEEEIKDSKLLELSTDKSVHKSMAEFISTIKEDENSIVFPVLHGNNGEDGTIQGLLELLNIPYVGSGVLGSAAGMDKVIMSDILAQNNIPQSKYISFKIFDWKTDPEKILDKIETKIKYPYYVKPANSGSSVGISKATTREELKKAIELAFIYDPKIIIEEEVIGREIQVAVLGNENPIASVTGELIMEDSFYDYNTKYINNTTIPVIPARLDKNTEKKLKATAIKVFEVLECSGIARVDIFVTDDNHILVNEINTMPGFTPISMAPVLIEKTDGTTYPQLVEKLLNLALEKHKLKNSFSSTKCTD